MVSVTQRIKQIKQPRGGYVKPKEFAKIEIESNDQLHENENIHSILMGLVVDYMTRYINGASPEEAFQISLIGASIINETKFAKKLLNEIKGLDDRSIINGCKLVGYDVCFRAGTSGYRPVKNIEPDGETIENIRIMIQRSLKFIELYGPITLDGFTFNGGYTDIISSGDGDFLTESTLWDFKVSKNPPTSAHTLQILIYYLMGKKSVDKVHFQKISSLGIFNPRLNIIYILEIDKIPEETIKEVSEYVIGYSKTQYKNSNNLNKNFTKAENIEKESEVHRSKQMMKKKSKILIAGSIIAALGVATIGLTTYNNQKKINEELKKEIAEIKKDDSLKNQEISEVNRDKKEEAKIESSDLKKGNTSKPAISPKKENNELALGVDANNKAKLEAEYIESDRELNNVWKGIVSYGADYPEVIQKQKEWIKYKDSKDLGTKVKLTQERVETLNKWLAYQMRIQGQNGAQFAEENPCPSLEW